GGGGCTVGYEYAKSTGCLVAVRDPAGNVESYAYDARKRMISATTRGGVEFAYEYDRDTPRCLPGYGPDRPFGVDPARAEAVRGTVVDGEEPRVIVWNDQGRAERILLPDGTLLDEAAFDDDGLVIASANGAGEGWRYWYDDRGRRIRTMD